MKSMKAMKQLSLAQTGFLPKAGKQTRKAVFLAEMETVVPWSRLETLIEPFYPKKGNSRRPMPLATMLRIHFMQQWFGYSDPAMEEARHDIPLSRQFAGLDAFEDAMPDESTNQNNRTIEHLASEDGLAILVPTKKPKGGELTEQQKKSNRILLAIRAVVEHPFQVIKQQFCSTKVRYRGLKKNTGQIVTPLALQSVDGTSSFDAYDSRGAPVMREMRRRTPVCHGQHAKFAHFSAFL
jgi:hypothetical protein